MARKRVTKWLRAVRAAGPKGSLPVEKPDWIGRALPRAGILTPEEAEAAIHAGRVSIGGRIVREPLSMLRPADEVRLDGRRVSLEAACRCVSVRPNRCSEAWVARHAGERRLGRKLCESRLAGHSCESLRICRDRLQCTRVGRERLEGLRVRGDRVERGLVLRERRKRLRVRRRVCSQRRLGLEEGAAPAAGRSAWAYDRNSDSLGLSAIRRCAGFSSAVLLPFGERSRSSHHCD